MTDPAIEAARRASLVGYQGDPAFRPVSLATAGEIAAAREALAPLRAKHQRVRRPDGSYRCTSCRDAYGGHADFPTGTDRLLYSDAELNPGGTTP